MDRPEVVAEELGDEPVATHVSLGGDELYVTPTRTLVYRGEGLLSDESVESFPHDADRLATVEKRRKARLVYTYGRDERGFSMPAGRLEAVLEPVLAGVLAAGGVVEDGERVTDAFRFSELTLVVTTERLLKHVGSAVWDGEFDAFAFEDVADVAYEEGSVATGVVLTVDGRKHRMKTPNEHVPAVREALESALRAYHGVQAVADISPADDEDDETDASEEDSRDALLGDGIDPLVEESPTDTGEEAVEADADGGETDEDGPETADADARSDDAGGSGESDDDRTTAAGEANDATAEGEGDEEFARAFEPAGGGVGERVERLEAAVERQNELIERNTRAIQKLIEELRERERRRVEND
jgi:hypothetical protein